MVLKAVRESIPVHNVPKSKEEPGTGSERTERERGVPIESALLAPPCRTQPFEKCHGPQLERETVVWQDRDDATTFGLMV
jgi:hypothetical protein